MTQKRMPTVITPSNTVLVRLRLCEARDQGMLRAWKNSNRQYFFHKHEISEAKQLEWFSAYLARPDDHMYVIEESVGSEWLAVGVAGVRLLADEDVLDAYNIMRGSKTANNRVNMGACFRLLCDTAAREYRRPVGCKVLKTNPALAWYKRLGFRCTSATPEYEVLVDSSNGGTAG